MTQCRPAGSPSVITMVRLPSGPRRLEHTMGSPNLQQQQCEHERERVTICYVYLHICNVSLQQ